MMSNTVLFASINHHRGQIKRGHYTATLFDGQIAYERNDNSIKNVKTSMCTDDNFCQTTRWLFYQKVNATDVPKSDDNWVTTSEEREEVEGVWFGGKEVPVGCSLSNDDMRTLAPKSWLNGEVIDAFLHNIRLNLANVLVLDTNTFTSLSTRRATTSLARLFGQDMESTKLVLVPINHKSKDGKTGDHWTIASVFPHTKTIVHCDSGHRVYNTVHSVLFSLARALLPQCKDTIKEWTFVSLKDVELQLNGYDCGIYSCVNGYSLLMGTFIFKNIDTSKVRYWVASVVLRQRNIMLTEKKKQQHMKSIPIETELLRGQQILLSLDALYQNKGITALKDLHSFLSNVEIGESVEEKSMEDESVREIIIEDESVEEYIISEEKEIVNLYDNAEGKRYKQGTSTKESEDDECDDELSMEEELYVKVEKKPLFKSIFCQTMECNKQLFVLELKNSVHKKSDRDERVEATLALEKEIFIMLAKDKYGLFIQKYGRHDMDLLLSEVKGAFVDMVQERRRPVHRYKGVKNSPLPHIVNFNHDEVLQYLILPAVLVRYVMETSGKGKQEAGKELYEPTLPTVFHIPLLLRGVSLSHIISLLHFCYFTRHIP